MQHPFEGILASDTSTSSTRRQALQCIVGGSATALALSGAASANAQDADAKKDLVAEKPSGEYHLYFVAPMVAVRKFSSKRRRELKVQGTFLPGLAGNSGLRDKPGFLAWWTKDQATAAASEKDIASVHRIEPEDVAITGKPPKKGAATLRVMAAPFDWATKPQKDTYQGIGAMGKAWASQLGMHPGVKIVANKAVRSPFIVFTDGKVPDTVVDAIKSHPQVYALQWMTPVGPTSKRLGEEGGATTERVGEEGGVTTQALGEEGATTGAFREEGASTRALGEEGGIPRPSTKALGEEGGRPRPQPTTLAIGEEGGRGKAPAILPKDGPTSAALGEEGGGK